MEAWPSPSPDRGGIYFSTHQVRISLPNKSQLKKWLRSVFESEHIALARLDYIFCNDAYLLEINQTHLGHDEYTDIITFPLDEDPVRGEIYISVERVADNARKLNVSAEEELLRVIVHGALHLCGYADETPALKKRMRQREDHWLSKWRSQIL